MEFATQELKVTSQLSPVADRQPPVAQGFPHRLCETASLQGFNRSCVMAHHALNGTVRAAKRSGRFTINQPMNTETQVHPERPIETVGSLHPDPVPPARKRILLADDSPQIRESLSKLLRKAGYHVTLVAHGGQALDWALEDEFDLLLLDLNMPGTDGWETLDHLACLKPALPVVVITAQSDQREWAESEGARALMEKPLDLLLLLQTIRDFTTASGIEAIRKRAGRPARFGFAAPVENEFRFSDSSRRWGTN